MGDKLKVLSFELFLFKKLELFLLFSLFKFRLFWLKNFFLYFSLLYPITCFLDFLPPIFWKIV